MIDKCDKDFLAPDRPVPTALNTHLGPGRRCEVTSGQPGQSRLRIVTELRERRDWRDERDERDETVLSVGVGVCVAGETRPDKPAFHLAGAAQQSFHRTTKTSL